MAFIYLITNAVNGKRYVGKTSKRLVSERWNEHRSYAKGGSNQYIHKAMRKYGAENFKFELFMVVPVEANVAQWERWTISALQPEYNLTAGGEGIPGYKMTLEARAKMRAAKLGKKQSPEHMARRFAWHEGYHHSEETKAKISASNKGKKISEEHKQKFLAAGRIATSLWWKNAPKEERDARAAHWRAGRLRKGN